MEKIFEAISEQNNIELEKYLKSNDINIINENNESLLHYAIKHSNENAVKMLIENYINLNIQDRFGNTPLIFAIIHNKIGFFKHLIRNQANLNLANFNNETPILIALNNNREEMVKILFEKKVDLSIKNKNEENIYFYLVRSHNLELLKLLLNDNIEYIYSKNYCNNTLLHQSVSISDYEITKYLLESGLLSNVKNKFNETPIFNAVKNGDIEMISILIKYGALLDIENSFFETIYNIADKKILEFLDYKETSVNYLKYIKKYPLHCAVIKNDYNKVKQLLTKYNISKKDNFDYLAIEYAKKLNYLEIYKLLFAFQSKNK